jgi:hypothetical protein
MIPNPEIEIQKLMPLVPCKEVPCKAEGYHGTIEKIAACKLTHKCAGKSDQECKDRDTRQSTDRKKDRKERKRQCKSDQSVDPETFNPSKMLHTFLVKTLGWAKGTFDSYSMGFFIFAGLVLLAIGAISLVKTQWRTTWGGANAGGII